MPAKPTTVTQYLAALPADRRAAIAAVRKVILKNLPKGYKEGIQYGMIGYFVPHSVYPAGYHCDPKQPLPFAHLASQKNHMAVYLMCVYMNVEQKEWFCEAWTKTGKKLDMGKSCVRFKKIEDVPLEVIGQAVKRVPVKKFVESYEAVYKKPGKPAAKKTTKKAAKKKAVKKATKKKVAKKVGKKVGKTTKKTAKRR